MKIILLTALAFFFSMGTEWKMNFEDAKLQAAQEKKHILLNFSGSDWCVPCKKLKKNLLSNADFLAYADKHLVLVNADFPIKAKLSKVQALANEQLSSVYNPKGDFPLTLLLDSKGKVLATWKGLIDMDATAFVEHLKSYTIH